MLALLARLADYVVAFARTATPNIERDFVPVARSDVVTFAANEVFTAISRIRTSAVAMSNVAPNMSTELINCRRVDCASAFANANANAVNILRLYSLALAHFIVSLC
jgi:hypothetical protein